MVAAVAVQNVDGADLVEQVLLGPGAVGLGHARVKAGAQQGGQAGLLKLFLVSPLPAVIEVGGEALLLAAAVVHLPPGGVGDVLRLVVGGVQIIHTALQAGVHDGQILIGQGDVHHQIRLHLLDQGHQLVLVVRVHLLGGDLGGGLSLQLSLQGVAFGFGAAGNAQLAEHIGVLAALLNGHAGHAAAADY